ncbi:response regulator transcription factor [bacterium SCSIO 12741]|nr:response regulator transcription factor [bacterium SCSIO 12741]
MIALIVDDEPKAAEYLEILLEQHCPKLQVEAVMHEPLGVLKILNSTQIDILFLDIEMPVLSGFELLELVSRDRLPQVIFTTAHLNYALQAYDYSPIHFLLKPIDPEKLKLAVDRAFQMDQKEKYKEVNELFRQLGRTNGSITLPDGNDYHVVPLDDIQRIEGSGSYSTFYLTDGSTKVVSKRIKVFVDELEQAGFFRPHQSHLVNLNYVRKFSRSDGGYLTLENGDHVPVSHGMRNAVKERLGM